MRVVVLACLVCVLALASLVSACNDSPPDPGTYSCAQQRDWGKCGESWMKGHCEVTCGTCSSGGSGCNNSPPDNQYTCQQQKDWGKCSESWMKGHCESVCGTCGGSGGGGGGCTDVPPDSYYSCAQQKEWGKCGESWMGGFCQCSCGASAGGGGGGSGNAAETPSMAALNIKTTSNSMSAPLKSYGAQYQTNKRRVVAALRAGGFSEPMVKLMLAIAMLETNTMDPDQRDTGKTGDATNYSLWNVNRDMLSRLPSAPATEILNQWSGLAKVVQFLKEAVNKFGLNGFLNFHRGGSTGYADGVSYGCQDYRNAMASMVRILDNNADLMDDSRRIDMVVGHV